MILPRIAGSCITAGVPAALAAPSDSTPAITAAGGNSVIAVCRADGSRSRLVPHWNSAGIRDALDRLPDGARDESVAFNTMGDNQARLEDIGRGRVEAMDAAGIDVSILSVVTPATQAHPAREAVALARDANDEASDAVRAHPARCRAFATLPTSDPQAAAAELERCATQLGHVGAMVHGRTGTRPLDDSAYDDLYATAARWHQPIFIHPQIPSNELRDAAYRGLDPLVDLGLATFGWGWHMDAGLSALRLILRGTFDRHPDLQVVLGHWGKCCCSGWTGPTASPASPGTSNAGCRTRGAHQDRLRQRRGPIPPRLTARCRRRPRRQVAGQHL